MTPRARKTLAALLALAILAVVTGYVIVKVFFDDAPRQLNSGDLDRALTTPVTTPGSSTASPTPASAGGSTTAAPAASTTPASPTTLGAPAGSPAGTWSVVADATTVGYRIKEKLGGVDAEAAGRTSKVTGSLTISGTTATAAEFSVDVASITSNSDRRDGQFRGRIMEVATFPTATFKLTSPINFGAPAEGTSIKVTATGELTLHGVTKSVTFPLEAKLSGGRIGVLGNIPVVFADYQVANPSNGFATTEDHGLLEFVVVFAKA